MICLKVVDGVYNAWNPQSPGSVCLGPSKSKHVKLKTGAHVSLLPVSTIMLNVWFPKVIGARNSIDLVEMESWILPVPSVPFPYLF